MIHGPLAPPNIVKNWPTLKRPQTGRKMQIGRISSAMSRYDFSMSRNGLLYKLKIERFYNYENKI
jgi:hypothetical protein